MKKFRMYWPAIVLPVILFSCQQRAEDIDVSKLNTPCESIDALIIVYGEINDLLDGKQISNVNGLVFKEIEEVTAKGREIEEHARQKGMSDLSTSSSCPNYQKYKELDALVPHLKPEN